uniref:Reverse transcriptase zinc-binding domain-containing protein n=1 Tax=Fagus sylvatica TaxID=28930 RepID=A0A2N9IMJ1_FAGSY
MLPFGHEDKLLSPLGVNTPGLLGPVISKFITAFRELATYKELLRSQCGYVMAGWCCMCKDDMETVDHLFLHCGVAREVWNYVLRSFGIEWVLSKRVIELLFGWWNWLGKSSSGVCNLVPSCLLWTIWWERNNRTFENIESPMGKIIEIFSGSFDWSRAWGLTSSSSVGNVLESLNADYSAHSL